MDDHTKIIIAVGASVGANCHPCLEYHVGKALEASIDRSEIMEVVEIAKAVRRGAAVSMDKLALNILNDEPFQASCATGQENSCCC